MFLWVSHGAFRKIVKVWQAFRIVTGKQHPIIGKRRSIATKKLTQRRQLLGALINIILNILLIKEWGIYAASFSSIISYLILAIGTYISESKTRKLLHDKG